MSPRRDAGRPRGAPIEAAILAATLDELAAHGLDGLSIPRVAQAADVNKTTVYRRWPTPDALVAAALEASAVRLAATVPDTGSLAGDLTALLDTVSAAIQAPEGRALLRAGMSEQAAGAVAAMARDPLVRQQEAVVAMVTRAVARGEWDVVGAPPDVILGMVVGGALHRALLERQPTDAVWRDAVVRMVTRAVAP